MAPDGLPGKKKKPMTDALREALRHEHYRRTKHGELVHVSPSMVHVHVAEHGIEPLQPKDTNKSVYMGKKAMELAIQGHNVIHAMHRKGIGWIDFIQGNPGDGPPDFENGRGISHIKAKRDFEHSQDPAKPDGETTLKRLPDVIARGAIFSHRGERIEIRQDGYVAILLHVPAKETETNQGERWLVSGFKKG